jgi:cell division transport system permease protein
MKNVRVFFSKVTARMPRRRPDYPAEPVPLRPQAAIVPPRSIAGRALVVVLGIMCFLAGLAVASVALVMESASAWQKGIAREATIQVRPLEGINTANEVNKAIELARQTSGIVSVRALSKLENERLLEPWLGPNINIDNLPVPQLILLELDTQKAPNLAGLASELRAKVKGASLDDHRLWRDRLALMTGSVVAIGGLVLMLVLVAAALSVIFSTRAAMAANRDIVEVLNLVGAGDRFIARAFQRRFLQLGLEGGLVGGSAALVAFPLTQFLIGSFFGAAGKAQLDIFIGGAGLTMSAVIAIIITLLAIALIAAATSRITVGRYLREHM